MNATPLAIAIGLLAATLAAAGCQSSTPPAAQATPAILSGAVTVDGSSTVYPVSQSMAESFQRANAGVKVTVTEDGTGGGMRQLCAGQVDIAGASRPIDAEEERACASAGIEFIELPLAFDALSVVVHPSNTAVSCLETSELRQMWEPGAQGKVTRWSQVRSGLPDAAFALFGPGTDSGTFDYFTLAVNGKQGSSRSDYTQSEDDAELVQGVEDNPNALGYFGYAYYRANADKLRLVAIDEGQGCILPSPETVNDGTYALLARPLFIYASAKAIARPEVKAFARHYVSPEHAEAVQKVGYVPLPTGTLLSVARRLETNVTGSIFDGRGSVLGVTADVFVDDDRIKNALVR